MTASESTDGYRFEPNSYEFKPGDPIDLRLIPALIEAFKQGWLANTNKPPNTMNSFTELQRVAERMADLKIDWAVSLRTTYYIICNVERVNKEKIHVNKEETDKATQKIAVGGQLAFGIVESILEVKIQDLFTDIEDDSRIETVPCFVLSDGAIDYRSWGSDERIIVPILSASGVNAYGFADQGM